MRTPAPMMLKRYAVTVLSVALAAALRYAEIGLLGDRAVFLIFYPAVIASAAYGGLFYGLLATVLSASAALFLTDTPGELSELTRADWVSAGWFLLSAAAVTGICESMLRARARAVQAVERSAALEQSQVLLAQVQREKDRIAALLNSISDEVWFTDEHGRITYFNPAARNAFGLEEAGSADMRSFAGSFEIWRLDGSPMPPDELASLRALRGETVTNADEAVRLPGSGEIRYRQVSATPVRDASGAIVGCVSVVRDVTSQHEAEDALRHREREFHTLVERAPDVIARYDRQLRHLYVNPAVEALSGHRRDEFIGKTSAELGLPTQATAAWAETVQGVFETGQEGTLEFAFPGPAGVAWYHMRAVPEANAAGSVESVITVFRDISERKHMEDALRESETRFRSLFNGMLEGFAQHEILHDAEGGPCDMRFVAVNDAFEQITGLKRGKLVGALRSTIMPQDNAFWLGVYSQVSSDRAAAHFYYDASSLGRWYEILAYCPDPDQFVVAFTNITERRQLEIARVREDRAKDEFIAMLSHELRNPLAAIANAATLVEMQAASQPELRRPADVLTRQVRHTARLVDDLLDVSRITHGRLELRIEPVDLVAITRSATEAARPQMTLNRLSLSVLLSAEPVWLDGDPARLEQVIGNLLNNAAKYTEPGGSIAVCVEADGDEAVCTVTDNGVGISPEMLPRVFDLFSQEERSLDRTHGGLGIGLSLAKTLVELHRGTVTAASEGKGRGSCFTVRLPLAAERSSSKGVGDHAPTAPSSRRVLLVEDNVDAAFMLAEVLDLWGHEVHVVHDGISAIDAAHTIQPDVVLMDIGLPGMDGYEVARRLRACDTFRSTRLVALTGYGREDDLNRSREAGFDDHLVKPVNIRDLQTVLAQPMPGQAP